MKILWDEQPDYGLVVEPEERMAATLTAIERMRSAGTFGEVRTENLPPWALQLVEQQVEYHEVDLEEPVTDATPWSWEDVSESVTDVVPLPWDAASVRQWLDAEVLAQHAQVGGASPGGNIDGYQIEDRDAFLAALQEQGYGVERRPGLVESFFAVL